MIQLHYYPSNASMIPHIVLEELGVPFELVLVDRSQDAHKSPGYLKLNPNGKIPTLVQREPGQPDLVLYESAAICLHLSDTQPKGGASNRSTSGLAAGLMPPLGTSARAHAYKWLFWLSNTFQPDLMMYFYPERYVTSSDPKVVSGVATQAQARIKGHLEQLDDELARVKGRSKASDDVDGGDGWFLGSQYTVLDAYVFTLCRWTRGFQSGAARTGEHLGPYLQRMLARPAVQRVIATEKLQAPLV
jgi:glutathione S-transferase